jgi:hypothetical protein
MKRSDAKVPKCTGEKRWVYQKRETASINVLQTKRATINMKENSSSASEHAEKI